MSIGRNTDSQSAAPCLKSGNFTGFHQTSLLHCRPSTGNVTRSSVTNCPRQESNLHGIATTRPSTCFYAFSKDWSHVTFKLLPHTTSHLATCLPCESNSIQIGFELPILPPICPQCYCRRFCTESVGRSASTRVERFQKSTSEEGLAEQRQPPEGWPQEGMGS